MGVVGVDREGLHVLLWARRGANGSLRIEQTRLADELQLTRHTINRVLARMVEEGRIVPALGSQAFRSSTYVVTDPKSWRSTPAD